MNLHSGWTQWVPVCIFNERQVSLVPLLQTLQQHPVLGPLQLQLPHLGMDEARVVEWVQATHSTFAASSPSSLLGLPPTRAAALRALQLLPGPPAQTAWSGSAAARPEVGQCCLEAALGRPGAASGILSLAADSAPQTLGVGAVGEDESCSHRPPAELCHSTVSAWWTYWPSL